MIAKVRMVATTAALLALVFIGPDGARGFSYFAYGGVKVVWLGAQSLRYMSPTTFPPGSTPDLLYRGAMGLWMIVPSATFQYSYDYYEPTYLDHYDGYSDTVAVSPSQLDPGVLAATYMVNYGARWYDMDMVFSANASGPGWNFSENPGCQVITNPAANGYSFPLVATHELGHALGLGHDPIGNEPPGAPWFIGTMNPRYPCGGPIGVQAIIELHADDRDGTRFLYPRSGQSPTVVDVANSGYATSGPTLGKAVPAAFTPTSVNPGQALTLRSVIENFGNTSVLNVRQGLYLSTDATIGSNDLLLGWLRWNLPPWDGLEFDVQANMPADIAAGTYYIGSILDDLNEVAEAYEDNNTHAYCSTLTIARLAPVINPLGQDIAACGQPYTGPTPTVTHPINMAPLTWSLDNPQPGMTINPTTGVISWPNPVRSTFPYALIVRATNSAGADTEYFFLGVEQRLPQMLPIADQYAPHSQPYTGPTPQLANPPCMTPILNWSLDTAPPGMTINHSTGVVSWASPVCADTPHVVSIRATNAMGNGTVTWYLHVTSVPGDLDCDNRVSVADLNRFADCMSGPQVPTPPPGCGSENFYRADLQGDNDVDLADFQLMQRQCTGA